MPLCFDDSEEVVKFADQSEPMWQELAAQHEVDLQGYDPQAKLEERLAWAHKSDLKIGTIYCRSSVNSVDVLKRQLKSCIKYAATNRIYVPHEFVWLERSAGNQKRPTGYARMLNVHQQGLAQVMLIDELSRASRSASQVCQILDELERIEHSQLDCCGQGLRSLNDLSGTNV